jgi:putative membrane protein
LGIRWIAIFTLVLLWSAINPREYFTWFLEVLPALIAFVLLLLTGKRFPFTPLAYTLILVHSIILMIGGHYTYAEMPLFDWLRDLFQLERNNYDKVGHFAQGFIPAIIGREILIRNHVVTGNHWLALIVVSICLAISAFYEMVEWWVALMLNEAAEAFIGAQGYVWDTQSDMAWALTGAVTALLLLSKRHDRQIAALGTQNY